MMDYKANLLAQFAPKVVPADVVVGDDTVTVYVKELSAAQVFKLQEKQKKDGGGGPNFATALLAEALVNEDGSPAMTVEDAKALAAMKIQAFNRLAEAVAQAVGLANPKGEEGKA